MKLRFLQRWLPISCTQVVAIRSAIGKPKLKALFLMVSLTVWVGCGKNPIQESNLIPQPIGTSLCANQIDLLQDPRNNWEVPVDSIERIDDYHRRCRVKVSNDDHTQRDSFEHPKIYPYIVIDSLEVSLMHVLRPSGGGYFGYANESLMIYYDDAIDDIGVDMGEAVQDFYVNFDANVKHEDRGFYWLEGPMVKLIFGDEPFAGIRVAIKKIAMGYLQGLSILSQRFYGADLCALDSGQLGELRQKYPLKIRLLKRNISRKR